MDNFIVIAVVLIIVGAAVAYLVRQKKNGVHCVGCPDALVCASRQSGAHGCSGKCSCCSGCSGCSAKKEDHE